MSNETPIAHSDPKSLLVAWHIHHVSHHLSVLLLILTVLIIKIINGIIRQRWTKAIPESLVTICLGACFGLIFKRFGDIHCGVWSLTPTVFFMYLLPFCIFDAAYNLHNRAFGDCIGAVIVFAVCATVLNMVFIGSLLIVGEICGLFDREGMVFGTQVLLLYASVIVAVDPVAVLAIFQEIGVDPNLYFLVLGESLLNDAVTVVLYKIVESFLGREDVTVDDISIGVAAFFTINVGAIFVGLMLGILSCLATRIHTHLEVVFLFLGNYAAYVLGDALGWSGLVAMITSGMVQCSYAFHNLSDASMTTCRDIARLLAEVCEGMIFLLIGIQVTSSELYWHTSFILYQLVVCLMVRTAVVFFLTWILNKWNISYVRITVTEQFILAYGGLRGAVALSLIYMVSPQKVNKADPNIHATIATATLVTILFTVGVMGPTMKPLVRLLRVKLAEKNRISLMKELNERMIDEITTGVEALTGRMGRNRLRTWFQRLDEKYIRLILQNDPQFRNQNIVKVYEEMALVLHQASIDPKRADLIMNDLPVTVKKIQKHKMALDAEDDFRELRRSALSRSSRYMMSSSQEYQRLMEKKRRELLELTAGMDIKLRKYSSVNRRPMAILIPKVAPTPEPERHDSKSKGLPRLLFFKKHSKNSTEGNTTGKIDNAGKPQNHPPPPGSGGMPTSR